METASEHPEGPPRAADKMQDQRVVCYCFRKSAGEIRDDVQRLGLESVHDVLEQLCAGNGCTLCRPDIEAILSDLWGE